MDRTQIFSGLEDRYQKYRPAHPSRILDSLRAFVETGRNDSWLELPSLIDVGAGTGILTRQLRGTFGTGFRYLAVEPGDSMRGRAEADTDSSLQIEYVAGTAEAVPA
jgi:ubiquinone/menaquinone biosynthesis C-methylase UbiE